MTSPETYSQRANAHQLLLETLASLDLPADPATLSAAEARQLLTQWLGVLETTRVAELEGLTDDLRVLAEQLDADTDPDTRRAALHRVGLSLERVAALGREAGLTAGLLRLGQRLLALSEQ